MLTSEQAAAIVRAGQSSELSPEERSIIQALAESDFVSEKALLLMLGINGKNGAELLEAIWMVLGAIYLYGYRAGVAATEVKRLEGMI